MVMTTGSFGKAVYPRPFTSWIGLAYMMYPDLVNEMFEVRTSDQSIEEVTILSGLDKSRLAPEGTDTQYDDMGQGLTKQYMFADYRYGFICTSNLIDDGKGFKVVEAGAKELARGMNEVRNILAYNVPNQGFNGSILTADGVTAYSTAHTTTYGTFSNILSTNASLSEAAVEQARQDVKLILNDRGLRMQIRLEGLYVPPTLEFEARRLFGSEYRVGTPNNDISAIVQAGTIGSKGAVVIDYLLNASAYFYKTNVDSEGYTFWDRKKPEYSQDPVFDSDNLKHKVHARMQSGISDARCTLVSQGM